MYFILKTNNQFKDINNGRKNKSKLQTEKIDETTKYFLEEIKIDQISKKQKKKKSLYGFQLLILDFTFTRCISISVFDPLVGIHIGITSCTLGLKIIQ